MCINFLKRSRKKSIYFYCRKKRKEITFNDCSNCSNKEYKRVKPIKSKTNKLKKLESKRYSILTNDFTKCYLCSKKKKHTHEIYKGCNRQISMKYGFCIPICEECHEETEINSALDKELKRECQREFERIHTREEFISIIGRSYL